MTATPPRTGRQLAAARVLAGITQVQLAERAGLHVNSIRYLERQPRITTGHSSAMVAGALADEGGGVLHHSHIRRPPQGRELSRLICCWSPINLPENRSITGAPLALTYK
jgi:transcriptional regulator with XRE-family HTH domain